MNLATGRLRAENAEKNLVTSITKLFCSQPNEADERRKRLRYSEVE